MLSMAELEELEQEVGPLEDDERPPQPDWYISLELCSDLGVSIFELEDLPMEEPFTSIVKVWAMLRREAIGMAQEIQEQARRLKANAERAAAGQG